MGGFLCKNASSIESIEMALIKAVKVSQTWSHTNRERERERPQVAPTHPKREQGRLPRGVVFSRCRPPTDAPFFGFTGEGVPAQAKD